MSDRSTVYTLFMASRSFVLSCRCCTANCVPVFVSLYVCLSVHLSVCRYTYVSPLYMYVRLYMFLCLRLMHIISTIIFIVINFPYFAFRSTVMTKFVDELLDPAKYDNRVRPGADSGKHNFIFHDAKNFALLHLSTNE